MNDSTEIILAFFFGCMVTTIVGATWLMWRTPKPSKMDAGWIRHIAKMQENDDRAWTQEFNKREGLKD